MRKVLAIILCFIMLIPATVVNAESFTQLSVNTDHLEVVKALGIMDGFKEYDVDSSYMTRGEFASVLCKLTNMEEYATTSKPQFNDVNEGHTYFNQIAAVSAQKIMIGDANGNFMPDNQITYSQAIKCLVYILGYEVQAEKKGGYPVGHSITADKLGMLENIRYKDNALVTRAEIAQIIYNSLDVEMYEFSTVSEEAIYVELNGGTILNKYLNIRKFEAVVNSVDGRSMLSRNKDTDKGQVKIGSTVLKYDDAYVPSLLGYRVEAFATNNGGMETLIYALPTNDNTEVMVKISDVLTEKSDFSLKKFYYTSPSGKTELAQLSGEHRFMYNGAYDLDFDIEDLDYATGYITLVDHNNDEIYDVCFVWNYENYVFESITDEYVICHYNKNLRKSTDDKVTYRVLGSDGEWGGWSQLFNLTNWDVLSVAVSKDGSLVTIYPTRSGIGGTVEAIVSDENTRAQINGYEYVISPQYLNTPANSGYIPIKSGLRSEFYFDVMGEIAAVYQVSGADAQYAYLMNAAPVSKFKGNYQVKLFDQNGKIQIYDVGEKIKYSSEAVDAKTCKTNEVFAQFDDGVGNFVPQMVRFSVDDNGVVTEIHKFTTATEQGYNLDKFSLDFDSKNVSETYKFQDSTASFVHNKSYEKVVHIAGSTKVFYLPSDNGEVIEDSMQITDSSIFENGNDYSDFQVFDCDDTYVASVLLYMPETGSDNVEVLDQYFIAVNEVYVGKNKDGEMVPMIKGLHRGLEEVYEYESIDGSTPKKGSIIQCQKTLKGTLKIHSDYVVYSPETGLEYVTRTNIKGTGQLPLIWYQVGRLYRKNGAALSVDVGATRPWAAVLNQNAIVYKYSKDDGKYVASNESVLIPTSSNPYNMQDGSFILLNYRYHYVREIFVIED